VSCPKSMVEKRGCRTRGKLLKLYTLLVPNVVVKVKAKTFGITITMVGENISDALIRNANTSGVGHEPV
jgi:hypothetical protein